MIYFNGRFRIAQQQYIATFVGPGETSTHFLVNLQILGSIASTLEENIGGILNVLKGLRFDVDWDNHILNLPCNPYLLMAIGSMVASSVVYLRLSHQGALASIVFLLWTHYNGILHAYGM